MRKRFSLFGRGDRSRWQLPFSRSRTDKICCSATRRALRCESLEDRRVLSVVAPIISSEWFAQEGDGTTAGSGTENIVWKGETLEMATGEWLLQLTEAATEQAGSVAGVESLLDTPAFAMEVVRGLGLEGMVLLEVEPGVGVSQMEAWLGSDPDVSFYEPNGVVHAADTIPGDTDFNKLWGMHNTGQTLGTLDADIDAVEAWDINTGSSDMVVAVIDTGVDYTHPDLAANIWVNPGEIAGDGIDNDENGFVDDVHGWDFNANDNDPLDEKDHGTHVAGTIAAVGDNGEGVVGVSWNAQIMAIRFLDAYGQGTLSGATAAINYTTLMRRDHGVNLVATNNSWGTYSSSPFGSLQAAVAAAYAEEIFFVAAAGNGFMGVGFDIDASIPSWPASFDYDNVVSVAATDHNDDRAGFSNYGQYSVDLGAPGVSVYSTVPGGTYDWMSGTSMAAPHVAGAIALLYSRAPEATFSEIRDALFATVDPIPALNSLA